MDNSDLGVIGHAPSESYTNQHAILWKIIAVYSDELSDIQRFDVWAECKFFIIKTCATTASAVTK